MKTGDVILFDWEGGWLRKLIRAYNQKVYGVKGWTHCGIIVKIESNGDCLVYEALSNGFDTINWKGNQNYYSSEYLKMAQKEGILTLMKTKRLIVNVKKCCDKYAGTPYGWLDLIGIVLFSMFGFKGLSITGAKRLICSEAVARVLYDASNKEIDFEKEFDKKYDLITPTDIFLSKQLTEIKL